MRCKLIILTSVGILAGLAAGAAAPEMPSRPGWDAICAAPHPRVACTAAELARLRAAWQSAGADAAPVAARLRCADAAVRRPLDFPPRGARHNQWRQCRACQTALVEQPDGSHQCPRCGKRYVGEPYDDVAFGRRHGANLRDMLDCAWAYAVTGSRTYAEKSSLLLDGYAVRYLKYPRRGTSAWHWPYNFITGGRLYDQTLSEASALAGYIAPAYDLIRNSGAVTPDMDRRIRGQLIRPMLKNIGRNWWNSGACNWQAWHNAAMFWGGAVLGDPAWMARSLYDPQNGFYFQMDRAVTADGMWHESSWGYHFYALQALATQAEGARRAGLDLWSVPALQAMFRAPFDYLMPDGQMPRLGDDVGSAPNKHPALMEAAFFNWSVSAGEDTRPAGAVAATGILRAALPARPVWETVLYGRQPEMTPAAGPVLDSRLFQAAGHAILRRGGPAGLTALLVFGPYGGAHGHLDKLSFVFYGYGRELAVDPGRAASQAYRLPIHKQWYKATLSHNTVIVNGKSQRPCSGEWECFERQTEFAAAVASACPWPGVRHRRLLLLTDECLLVADDLSAPGPARFDWLYHHRADTVECAAAHAPAPPPADIAGAGYIENCRRGITDQPLRAIFRGGGLRLDLMLAGGLATRVMTGDGPGRSLSDRVPLLLAGREGRAVWFAAAAAPAPAGAAADLQTLAAEREGEERLRVKLRLDNRLVTAVFGPHYLRVETQAGR